MKERLEIKYDYTFEGVTQKPYDNAPSHTTALFAVCEIKIGDILRPTVQRIKGLIYQPYLCTDLCARSAYEHCHEKYGMDVQCV